MPVEGEDTRHQSLLLDYIPGQPVNLEKFLLPLWFRIRSESGEFICKAWGLCLEGAILVYDPIKDQPDLIPIEGCMNDLSWAETMSMKELSELVLRPWEWQMRRMSQGRRGEEEGSLTDNKTDNGPNGRRVPRTFGIGVIPSM